MPLTIHRGKQVSRWQLFGNHWNPNITSLTQQSAIRESLGEFGQIADLIVWPHPNPPPAIASRGAELYQVIDGEHRLLEYKNPDDQIFVNIVRGLSPEQAMRLTVILDYTKGDPDPLLLADLLATLEGETTPMSTPNAFPGTVFNLATLDSLLASQANEPQPPITPNKSISSLTESWTRRTVSYSSSAAFVINAAIEHIQASQTPHRDPGIALGQVLEYLAADYLSRHA